MVELVELIVEATEECDGARVELVESVVEELECGRPLDANGTLES